MECRADDEYARAAVDKLVSAQDTKCATAERTVLAELEAGCTAPVASSATIDGELITLRGGVFALDGSAQLVEEATGTDPVELGREVAKKLFDGGAARFL